ncbi:hypothetical protein [Bradyrhizobium sp. ORS 111]|uniref:hypothetical protein n=1 Tax=Bradyrhizobium sp. ORS 111 TaxID=1685958 RepID=UPI00388E8640
MAITDRRSVSIDPTSTFVKAPVRVVATGSIALSGLQTIDGVALNAVDRVQVVGQSDHHQWLLHIDPEV